MFTMVKSIIVPLAACLLVGALRFPDTSAFEITQGTFIIKGPKIEGLSDGATKMRPFLSPDEDHLVRCQKYGLVLKKIHLEPGNKINYFDMVNIARMTKERLATHSILSDELRQLYMSAINEFREKKKYVNAATVEMYQCIKKRYGHNLSGTIFLNDKKLQKIIEQYEAIISQPAKLLLEGKHPTLKLEDLDEVVAKSVARWFKNGEADLSKMFRSVHETNSVAHADASQYQEPNSAHHHDNQNSSPKFDETSSELGVDQANEVDAEPNFPDVFGALILTFEKMPEESLKSQRCQAYNTVILASYIQSELFYTEGFISEVVDEIINETPHSEETFVPDELDQKYFVSVLEKFDPTQGDPNTWLDMIECVEQWESEPVKKFLHSEELQDNIARLEFAEQYDDSKTEVPHDAEPVGSQQPPVAGAA